MNRTILGIAVTLMFTTSPTIAKGFDRGSIIQVAPQVYDVLVTMEFDRGRTFRSTEEVEAATHTQVFSTRLKQRMKMFCEDDGNSSSLACVSPTNYQ